MRDIGEKTRERRGQSRQGALTWRWLAVLAAGLGLTSSGCGGRAQDTVDGDVEGALGSLSEREGDDADDRPGRAARSTGTSVPRRPERPEVPPRDGEICYSPASLRDQAGVGLLLSALSDDILDESGCLTSEYTDWLDRSSCRYDPRPAVVRGERCCHLLDAPVPDCERR